jgi:hypothetical protein
MSDRIVSVLRPGLRDRAFVNYVQILFSYEEVLCSLLLGSHEATGERMRLFILAVAALAVTSTASAQVYVHGYTTKNGTYVAPHYRSSPDGNPYNNYSTVGNVNPYTGQAGTKNPYGSSGSSNSSYGSYSNRNSSSSSNSNNSSSQNCLYYTPC